MIDKLGAQYSTTTLRVSGSVVSARWPTLLFATVLLLCACATVPPQPERVVAKPTESRPVVAGVDDVITVRAMSVRLPAAAGWKKREVPMADGAVLIEIERALTIGNRVQIHVADYFGAPRLLPMELMMSGLGDAERLTNFLMVMAEAETKFPGQRQSQWVDMQREPQRSFRAACREKHELREERAGDGKLYLWQDWMLYCVDPVSHLPVQVDYAERFAAEGGTISPTFVADAAAFFDSIEFRAAELTARPTAEVSAALIQANTRLFSDVDQKDYPASLVFSLDPNIKEAMLPPVGRRLFLLKGTSPRDPSENAIAAYLTDERPFYTRFMRVPESIANSDKVFVGDLVIHRARLPKGHLGKGSGYAQFIFRIRVYPATEHEYRLEHVGIQWLK